MTFAEMKAVVFRRVRESPGGGRYFSDDDMGDAINDGYMELSDQTEWFEEALTIDLLKQRPYYDLFSIIGPVFLSLKPCFHDDTSRWLIPSSTRDLDRNDDRQEVVVGTPERILTRGIRWMGLYPRTNTDSGTLKTYYTRLPTPMCADGDYPGFPDLFHMGCVEFALADLFAQDAEPKLAVAAWQEYTRIEAQLEQWVNQRVARPQTRVVGALTVPR